MTKMEEQYPEISIVGKPHDEIKHRARTLFHEPDNFLPDLKGSFCSSHTGLYIFDAFCDIYTCWERTGDPSVRIGSIAEDGKVSMNIPVFSMWRNRTVASGPVCSKCRYALYCGGGCAVLAEGRTGKFNMNYCDGFGSSFRAAVSQAYTEHISGATYEIKESRICDQ